MTWDEIKEKADDVAAGMARDAVQYGRQILDVPYPRASVPGEVPRRRSGTLRDSAYADVIKDGDNLIVKFAVSAPYAHTLEASGRLITEPVREYIESEFRSRLQALFT